MATFKTRARTVDMLGRQQIANVSTALSELFKNAHDAYARQTRADLLVAESMLVLRDDGTGMTESQFRENWLTLATDNKAEGDVPSPPSGFENRPVLGAKGIGRLAIALVGPQTLILTRSLEDEGNLVCAFVNWSLFSEPHIDLEDVEVPVHVMSGGTLPSSDDIGKLVKLSKSNVESVIAPHRRHELVQSLDQFNARAVELLDRLPGPSLRGEGHGTHFIVSPVRQDLLRSPGVGTARGGTELTTNLVGFANTMTPGHPPPALAVSMWVHSQEEQGAVDVLAESEFLTVDEFRSSDHQISGRFDESGTFRGEVSIYGGRPQEYELRPEGQSRALSEVSARTKCGPFDLHIAVIQPSARQSRLSGPDHKRLNDKLGSLGGIYVYRNGIRVLPYGRPEVDWLDIEEHRTKNLGKAFYSHRRMFGAVLLADPENASLQEKAGREGFQQNIAYRQLRSLIRYFLRATASEFFVRGGAQADQYFETRDRTDASATARKAHAETVSKARIRFESELASAYVELSDGKAEAQILEAMQTLRSALERVDSGENLDAPVVEQQRAIERIRAVQQRLTVEPPAGVGLTREMRRDLSSYDVALANFERAVIEPMLREVARLGAGAQGAVNVPDLARVVARRRTSLQHDLNRQAESARAAVAALSTRVERLVDYIAEDVDSAMIAVLAEAGDPAVLDSGDDRSAVRLEIERKVEDVYRRTSAVLRGFASAIESMTWETDGATIITSADVSSAVDEELAELQEAAEDSLDLIQLGMALSIVDHEFGNVVTSLRRSVQQLQAWADVNPVLEDPIRVLSATFEHLNSYLDLLTPLQRRSRATRVTVRGADLARFLLTLFRARLEESGVELRISKSFMEWSVHGHRSTWYPALVNLVDNAIYWAELAGRPAHVEVEASASNIMVSDSGRGIGLEDYERIFEPRFSLKPGGRGLGLSITREVLQRDGYSVRVGSGENGTGARFTISLG